MNMSSFLNSAEEGLKQNGFRLSTPRRAVLSWIQAKDGVFCAADMIKELTEIDRVSVYRTIDVLSDLDIIHQVYQKDGQQYYEVDEEGKKHHHHVTCDRCGKDECIDCPVPVTKVPGFSLIHHVVHFTGVCVKCL